jgi:hypothetical protein
MWNLECVCYLFGSSPLDYEMFWISYALDYGYCISYVLCLI